MTTTLFKQTQQKIKQAAGAIGISESEVVDRALDVFLVAQEAAARQELREEMRDWQELGFASLRRLEERMASPKKSSHFHAKR